MNKIDQRVAVITGASQGIGSAIARRLVQDGNAVVINYDKNDTPAHQLVQEISDLGGKAIAVKADVTKLSEIKLLFENTVNTFGRLDILVNNAGVGALMPLEKIDEDSWDRLFALNAKAPLFVTQEAVKHMVAGGRVVNISSSTTYFPGAGMCLYAASKMVTRVYTENLAYELGLKGLTINTVVPGPTEPGMFEKMPPNVKAEAAAKSPFNRIGKATDIAGVVSFLVGEDACWITGQHILVNGGASI